MADLTTEQQAAEALAAAVALDGDNSPAGQLESRVNEIKAEQAEVAADTSVEGTTNTDSFTSIDFNELPVELQGYAKSLQGDYTRKTQKLAEERKQYEELAEYGGLDTALEAVKFAQNLASDSDFAMQVQEQLFTALTDAGMSPKAAAVEVQRQVDEATDDTFADFEDDDPLVKELKAVKAQLNEVSQWKQQQDAEANNRQLAAQIQLQENEILATNPDYVQDDLNAIYALAYSTGGNLIAAEKVYQHTQERILNNYIQRKASVNAGSAGIVSNGVTQAAEAVEFHDLYDPKLEALVQERLAQEIAAGNL